MRGTCNFSHSGRIPIKYPLFGELVASSPWFSWAMCNGAMVLYSVSKGEGVGEDINIQTQDMIPLYWLTGKNRPLKAVDFSWCFQLREKTKHDQEQSDNLSQSPSLLAQSDQLSGEEREILLHLQHRLLPKHSLYLRRQLDGWEKAYHIITITSMTTSLGIAEHFGGNFLF